MTRNTDVHGTGLIGGGGDLSQLKELEADCYISGQEGTGVFDFVAVEDAAVALNKKYFEHPPTLKLGQNGAVQRLAPTDNGIEYATFNSCDNSACANIWPGQMSVPDNIFFGQGNWNGVQGGTPDPNTTYVFNVSIK